MPPCSCARAHTHIYVPQHRHRRGVWRVSWRVACVASCGVCRVVSMRMRGQCVCLYISLYISLYYVMLEAAATRPVVELVFLYICLSLSVSLSVSPKYIHTYRSISHLSSIYLSIDGGQERSTKSAGVGCRVWGVGWRV